MIGSYKEKAVKGDYIGFTFNGVHSSDLGIMRVSNGSRYSSNLLPALSDIKGQVQNGRDGTAYFGSTYTQTPINLEVAFDKITEVELNRMKRLFGDKNPHYLWFDETPYKEILVKIAQPPQFNYIAFDETYNGGPARVYKGDAKINFISYTPYARSRVAYLDSPIDSFYFKYGYGEYQSYKIHKSEKAGVGYRYFKVYASLERTQVEDEEKLSIQSINRTVPLIWSQSNQYFDNYGNGIIILGQPNPTTGGEYVFCSKEEAHDIRKYSFPKCETIKEMNDFIGKWGGGDVEWFLENLFFQEGDQYCFILYKNPTLQDFYNYEEWKEASGLRKKVEENMEFNIFQQDGNKTVAYLYNAGDFEAPLYLTYKPSENDKETFQGDVLTLSKKQPNGWSEIKTMEVGIFSFPEEGFVIDSKLKNIKEIGNDNLITGKVFTDFLVKGDFFKIPADEEKTIYKITSNNGYIYQIEHPHLYFP